MQRRQVLKFLGWLGLSSLGVGGLLKLSGSAIRLHRIQTLLGEESADFLSELKQNHPELYRKLGQFQMDPKIATELNKIYFSQERLLKLVGYITKLPDGTERNISFETYTHLPKLPV